MLEQSSAYTALAEELSRVQKKYPNHEIKTTLEHRGVERIIRDILSLKENEPLEITKYDFLCFEQVACLMNAKSRKWASELQIALPLADLSGENMPNDAELKSRIDSDEHINLRNYYLNLLYKCIPVPEKQYFASVISLSDTNLNDTSHRLDGAEVLDAGGAWSVIDRCKNEILSFEKESRLSWREGEFRNISADEVRRRHELQLATFRKKIEARPWGKTLRYSSVSKDSLFSRLIVNAALNRYILENFAFEKRFKDTLPVQIKLFEELEITIPNGLAKHCEKYYTNNDINYKEMTIDAINISISNSEKKFTLNIWKKIECQTDAIVKSSELPEFSKEKAFIDMVQAKYDLVKALTWIILAWCYAHGKKIIDDDRQVHSGKILVISNRSKVITKGNAMVSLRRLLSTLMFSSPWDSISSERIALRGIYWSNVRMSICQSLMQDFKIATLEQWMNALNSFEAL